MTHPSNRAVAATALSLAVVLWTLAFPTSASAEGTGPFLLERSPIDVLKAEIEASGVKLETSALLDGLANHPDNKVRARIADFLGIKKQREGVGALLVAARKDEIWLVRWAAAEALHRLGQPQGLEILRGEMATEPKLSLRLRLAEKLARLGDPSGFGVLRRALSQNLYRHLALAAMVSFLRFEPLRPEILRLHLEATEDTDPLTRQSALGWLEQEHVDGYLEWSDLLAQLEKSLKDSDPDVREEARALIARWRLIHLGQELEKTPPPPPPKPGQPNPERRMP